MSAVSRTRSIAAALERMPREHQACRDYGHVWSPWRAEWLPRRTGIEQWLRCSRCETVRHRILNPRGEVQSSSYAYPEGYALPDLGRLTHDDRSQLRLTVALNTMVP